jgi:hypothetical protein
MQKFLSFILFSLCFGSAHGVMTQITSSPSSWRLENYAGGPVVAWFTSSTCASGQVSFGSSATVADFNRFWATVSIAKTTGKKMFLYYENANAPATCPIISFGLDSE